MYDAWTRNDTHNIGAHALYLRKKAVSYEGVQRTQEEVKSVLITVSPMSAICSTNFDDHENDNETNVFNAEVQIHYFENVFDYFSINFKN